MHSMGAMGVDALHMYYAGLEPPQFPLLVEATASVLVEATAFVLVEATARRPARNSFC